MNEAPTKSCRGLINQTRKIILVNYLCSRILIYTADYMNINVMSTDMS